MTKKENDTEQTEELKATETAPAADRRDEPQKQAEETGTAAAPEKDDESKSAPHAEEETPPDHEQKPEPGSEPAVIEPSQITDSTSIFEVTMIVAEDEGELLGDTDLHGEMERFNVGNFPDGVDTIEKQREYGKGLCLRYNSQLNKASTLIEGKKVDYFITLGDGFRRQKKLVLDSGLQWLEWIVANWPHISPRSIQRYMLLSRRTDAHPHNALGFERLMHLITVTQDDDVDDPITELLLRFGIDPESDSGETVQEFNTKVDAAALVKRLYKAGIPADFDQILRFVRNGYSFSARMISELKLIKDDRTRVHAYIEAVMGNLGKPPVPMETTEINHFNSSAKRMTGSIEEILKKPALARQVDRDEINTLEAKVTELKRLFSGA